VSLAAAVLYGVLVGTSVAADFRVQNSVFLEGSTEPISRTTTLFKSGRIYDIWEEPKAAAIFDVAEKRVIHLDRSRQVRVELSFRDIDTFTQQWRSLAATHRDRLFRFLLQPKFEEDFDAAAGKLVLRSDWLTYRITAFAPADRAAVGRYVRFSDVAVKLAPLINPNAPPPFARLAVNRVLGDRGQLPREVHLSRVLRSEDPRARLNLRAEHRFEWRLRQDDLESIRQIERQRVLFAQVGLEKFRQPRQADKRR